MKDYIKLMRVKHYIKNLLIFMPMFFGGAIFSIEKILKACIGFICFCLVSSSVYILNDYRDIEKDKRHAVKKSRPLASGKVEPNVAILIMMSCLIIAAFFSFWLNNWHATGLLIVYFLLNIAYSFGLKNKPIVDITILALGFIIRTFYGGFLTDVKISEWLYLVITSGSLYMGLGKRRNELKRQSDARDVLQYYNVPFLDKNMYVCVALANVFYALWTLEMPNPHIILTVPVFIIILMRYSLNAESESDGDPVEVILKDKILMGLIFLYTSCIFALIYVF